MVTATFEEWRAQQGEEELKRRFDLYVDTLVEEAVDSAMKGGVIDYEPVMDQMAAALHTDAEYAHWLREEYDREMKQ